MSMPSFVWKFFKVNDSTDVHAECSLCRKNVKRGSKPKTFSTTPLHKHVANHHPIAYASAKEEKTKQKAKEVETAATPKQRKLEAMKQSTMDEFTPKKFWDINHLNAKKIHLKIMKFMALDNQRFSVVEDQEFIELVAQLEPR